MWEENLSASKENTLILKNLPHIVKKKGLSPEDMVETI
jgi:hypothetical protein